MITMMASSFPLGINVGNTTLYETFLFQRLLISFGAMQKEWYHSYADYYDISPERNT